MAAGRNEHADEPICDEYVEFFLAGYEEKRKASSYRTARQNLGAFAKEFAGRALESISPLEAERWSRANRHRVQSVSTLFNDAIRKRLLALIRSVAWAAREGAARTSFRSQKTNYANWLRRPNVPRCSVTMGWSSPR